MSPPPTGGGNRPSPLGSAGAAGDAGVGTPRRSRTDELDDCCAAITVSVSDVAMNAIARPHVSFAIAVSGGRPALGLPSPPPMPRPPPSERWTSTTPIRVSASRRWTISTTFCIRNSPPLVSPLLRGWSPRPQPCLAVVMRSFGFCLPVSAAMKHGFARSGARGPQWPM